MPILTKYFTSIIAVFLLVLSGIAITFNYYVTQYPGNNYLIPGLLFSIITLGLSLYGVYLLFGKDSPYVQMVLYFLYFFLTVTLVAVVTTAAQYTPFKPTDQHLIAIDQVLAINLQKVVGWVNEVPWLRKILIFSYSSLSYQISYVPIIFIIARKYTYLKEFYTLVLLSALIGFSTYYFFPTIGPASSFIDHSCFTPEQLATGIKFTEIHHHIPPSTNEGGLIALPSFHVIWAWLILYLVRCWPIALFFLCPLNVLMTISCVLLGWHYFVDLIASLIVLLITHKIYFYCVKRYSDVTHVEKELLPSNVILHYVQNDAALH